VLSGGNPLKYDSIIVNEQALELVYQCISKQIANVICNIRIAGICVNGAKITNKIIHI